MLDNHNDTTIEYTTAKMFGENCMIKKFKESHV